MSARNTLLGFALFPTPRPEGTVAGLLWDIRKTRGLREWIKPGAYAYLVLTAQLKAQQRLLLTPRKLRCTR